jgi:hypothetical protein
MQKAGGRGFVHDQPVRREPCRQDRLWSWRTRAAKSWTLAESSANPNCSVWNTMGVTPRFHFVKAENLFLLQL